jgi:8-oxo-dGTP pyrophosphatase MutT (NUDIX family)
MRVSPEQLGTKLVGTSELHEVNEHLHYRQDEVRFPSGAEVTYTYIDDDYAAVGVVPLDRRKGRTSVHLVWQERYPSQTVGYEIPAGGLKEGEDVLAAAERELLEEAGLEADLFHVFEHEQVENVGRGNSRSAVVLGAGITAVGAARPDLTEVIDRGEWFPLGEVDGLIMSGRLDAGHTMAALHMAEAFLRTHPDHQITKLVAPNGIAY